MNVQTVLEQFYGGYDEDGRLRSPHGMVEYLTTMRYIEQYLRPGMRILEIGAGTGRYSHTLARMGYLVDAVELVQHNIDVFNQNTREGERITVTRGNACDLFFLAEDTYDITLLLGPMYHLFTVEDQKKALSEAIRVTKKGGVIFAAYCGNDATIGSISVIELDDRIEKAEIGYCIGKNWWHRGIMSEALRAVMDYLFDEVGFQRIVATHDTNNLNSGAVMRKCGMKQEGTLRRHGWNNQGICDVAIYGLLPDER